MPKLGPIWSVALTVIAPCGAALASPYMYTTITVPGIPGARVTGINNVGQIVGDASFINNVGTGFVETLATGAVITFSTDFGFTASATGINDLGQVSTNATRSGYSTSTIFDSVTGLSTPSRIGGALGINNAGSVTDTFLVSLHPGATEVSTVTNIALKFTIGVSDPAAANSGGTFVSGINNTGQVIGFESNPSLPYGNYDSGFIEDIATKTFTQLNLPGSARPRGINDTGQVVGYYRTGASTTSFVFDEATGQSTTLTVPGAAPNSVFAQGINNAGQIVGNFTDSTGQVEIFLATPTSVVATIPEPAGIALLLSGLGILGLTRRPRKSNAA